MLVSIILLTISCKGPKGTTTTVDKSRPEPNIVMILADDLGWQDVKCYDIDEPAPYETPNIDRLAKEGVLFWQGYSPAPTCAPSRCAIMSGNHPARAQKTHVVGGGPPTPYKEKTYRMMPPWYSGRMPENEMTLARALKQNNYKTGHSGKWHMAISHNAFPQPEDQGFDYSESESGIRRRIRPHRLAEFATDKPSDKYQLDENGFARHATTENAINFIEQEKANPFFLYYAEWLVHAPIQTRNRRLLEKYAKKFGEEIPTDPGDWKMKGQKNPYYCAMVEEFDYYVGKVINYLKNTDDPRWEGHKLIENTYIIFTSDNGGVIKKGKEGITSNQPLDMGKTSAMEGGTRVPLIISGPGIKKDVTSDVMVNGLDFYPTILAWTNTKVPTGKNLDGADLSTLLIKDPTNPALVKDKTGKERTTMVWHYPHEPKMESTIRMNGYKLIRNYDHVNDDAIEPLELYELYKTEKGKSVRVDIEEAKNLATTNSKLAKELDAELTKRLTEMKASYPYYNPRYKDKLLHKETVPTVTKDTRNGNTVRFTFKENGAKVVKANLIYSLNGGARYEEWFRKPAVIKSNTTVEATLPEGTTHYIINLIDENNFLVSFPEMLGSRELKKAKYSEKALSAK